MAVRFDTRARGVSLGEAPEAPAQEPSPTPSLNVQPQLGPLPFVPPTHQTPPSNAQKTLAVQSVSIDLANGRIDRARFQESLIHASAAGFSGAAEQRFVAELEKRFKSKSDLSPEATQDLAWVVAKTRAVLPASTSTPRLDAFLRERDFALRPEAGLVSGSSYQVDRQVFLAALGKARGGDPKRFERLLSWMAKDVVDQADLFWMQRKLTLATRRGQVAPEVAARVQSVIAPKLQGSVHVLDVADALRAMRKQGFSPESVAQYKETLAKNTHDDKVLFFAQRVAQSALTSAKAKAKDPETLARLESASAELATYLGERTEGRFDRYGQTRHLRRLANDGRITPEQHRALKAAALTASSQADFARGVSFVQTHYGLSLALNEVLYQSRSELLRTFAESASNDVRDSSGRVIETAVEREEKRRREERQAQAPKQDEARRSRAQVTARVTDALGGLARAKGPEDAASKQDALANARREQAEIAPERVK